MLLIFPPIAKACEPPAGISHLAGFLRGSGHECLLWDANLEGQLYLLDRRQHPVDTWSRRAWKNVRYNLQALRRPALYDNNDRYQRAVRDLNRALSRSCGENIDINLTLADYQDGKLSPHSSTDLLQAAEDYRANPFYPFFCSRLPELLTRTTDRWIGISLNYLSQALPAFALAGYIREKHPGFRLVIGGGLVTSWLRSPSWTNSFTHLFDHCVAGRGEAALLNILGQTAPGVEQPPDFSDLPLNDYLAPGLILPYSASSGCYWNRCSFCPEKAEGNPYLKRSSDRVIEDLRKLSGTYRPRLIHLLDNAVAPSLMKRLVQSPVGSDWYGFARVSPELSNPDFCRNLRRAGCVMLKLGIESGSQKVLEEMEKGIKLPLVEESLKALKGAGIATYVYLLFGTPAESIHEARQTLEFTVRNAGSIDFLNLAVFNLPRNSKEAQYLDVHDFSEGDLQLYSDFHHPKGWDRGGVRRFLSSEFKAHSAIRAILQRDPPLFTSNHAPFMAPSPQTMETAQT